MARGAVGKHPTCKYVPNGEPNNKYDLQISDKFAKISILVGGRAVPDNKLSPRREAAAASNKSDVFRVVLCHK